MQICNQTRRTVLGNDIREARTYWQRFKGWLGKTTALPGEGLYLSPCRSVHTLGMRFALDAVFITRTGKVLFIQTLAPGCCSRFIWKSRGVLELPAGVCRTSVSLCQVGDQLQQVNGKGW